MKLRWIRFRVTLLNIMLAMAVFSITLAISRPRTELWPRYLAAVWIYAPTPGHDPVTHETWAQGFTSPEVIRDILADPNVAALPRIEAATDPRKELLREIDIEVHPGGHGVVSPPATSEQIRVVVESATPTEAVLVRDALIKAYLGHHKPGHLLRIAPVGPERVAHPIFDRPWKFRAVVTLGLLLSVIVLIVPIGRSKRFWITVVAVMTFGLVFGAALWWLISHPEFYLNIGGLRIL